MAQASLQGLNEALGKEEAVPMKRFRPNIVVNDTGEPFSEDAWEAFTVQGPGHTPCKFSAVVPCDRCKVPLVDLPVFLHDVEGWPTLPSPCNHRWFFHSQSTRELDRDFLSPVDMKILIYGRSVSGMATPAVILMIAVQ